MKSTICSFRPLRKFLLAGAVLFSPYLLTHSTASEVCVRQKTVSTQTRFSIDLRNATLEEFVKQVERKTGYRFIYGEEVRLNSPITLNVHNATLQEILQKALDK